MGKSLSRWISYGAVVTLIAVSVDACTSKKEVPPDTSAAGQSNGAEAMLGSAPDGLIGRPGQDETETIKYMGGLKFDVPQDTAFTADFECPGCSHSPVKLKISPEQKAYKVDWPTAFVNRDNEGWVVASITNVDSYPYDSLQLAPNETAYQWIGPINDDGTDRAVAYYKIDIAQGKVIAGPMSPIRTVQYCDMPDWKKRKNSAAHRDPPPGHTKCESKGYSPPNGASTKALRGPLFPPGGTWLSCTGGCCQVSQT